MEMTTPAHPTGGADAHAGAQDAEAGALRMATCAAPTNIATIKYWGKRDVARNTPLNSSVSVTLHQDELRTKTTVAASPRFMRTQLWLNGEEQELNARVMNVLREIRALYRQKCQQQALSPAPWVDWHLRIVSTNSFPTAAGLASSAAGYACLVATLAQLYELEGAEAEAEEEEKEEKSMRTALSVVARQGSGSACRSMFGGFVRWEQGVRADGADSRAIQIAAASHWPSLCAVICVVTDREKDTSSTSGMTTSKDTSALLRFRTEEVVPTRLQEMEEAFRARDFATFATLTMQDSNQFHAVCLDTFPPIMYLNEVSRQIISLVHRYNAACGEVRAGYTFDAGPNAVLFVEKPHLQQVLALLVRQFPSSVEVQDAEMKRRGMLPIKTSFPITGTQLMAEQALPPALEQAMQGLTPTLDGVKMLYATRVGEGPRVLPMAEALVDAATGEPVLLPTTTTEPRQPRPRRPHGPLMVAAALVLAVAVVGSRSGCR